MFLKNVLNINNEGYVKIYMRYLKRDVIDIICSIFLFRFAQALRMLRVLFRRLSMWNAIKNNRVVERSIGAFKDQLF